MKNRLLGSIQGIFSGITICKSCFEHKSKEICSQSEKGIPKIAVCSRGVQGASFEMKDLNFLPSVLAPETTIRTTWVSRKDCNGDSLIARPAMAKALISTPSGMPGVITSRVGIVDAQQSGIQTLARRKTEMSRNSHLGSLCSSTLEFMT